MTETIKAKTKTERGASFSSSAYLVVPDADKPSTWKLRIEETPGKVTVAQLGRAAAALGPGFRGKKVQLSAEDRKAAAKKLIGKYRGKDVADSDIPKYLWGIAGMEAPGKAVNLDEVRRDIWNAWDELTVRLLVDMPERGGYVLEVWDEFVIVEHEGKNYRVSYVEGDDDITFASRDEWVEVEQVWQEVSMPTKSATSDPETAVKGGDEVAVEHNDEEESPVKTAEGLPEGEADADTVKCVNCGDHRAVKALGQNRIGEYLVLWGGPDQKDLDSEYFSRETEELTAIFQAVGRVPILYHHAMDGVVKTSVVGLLDIMQPDDIGMWVEGELDKASKYRQAIEKLVAEGALYWSSGTLPGARKAAPDGHLERWPIVEASLTPTPAEFRMLERPVADIKSAYKAAGLTFPQEEPEDKGAEEARQRDIALELERLELVGL